MRPLVDRVAEVIPADGLEPGDAFPSESKLADRFGAFIAACLDRSEDAPRETRDGDLVDFFRSVAHRASGER